MCRNFRPVAVLRRVAASFVVQLVALAVSFADRVVLVGILLRAWGTDLYSDWATLMAAAGLVTLGELGLNVYFGNQWQKAHAEADAARFQRVIGLSLTAYTAIGTVLAGLVVLFVTSVDVSAALSLKVICPGTAALVFLILAAAGLLRLLRGSISQIYRGRGQFAVGLWIDLIPVASGVALVGAAGAAGASPSMAAVIYVAADLVFGWVVMLWDQRRRYGCIHYAFAIPTVAELRDLLSKAGGYALVQGTPVAWQQAPVLIIGLLGYSGRALVSFVLARTLVNFTRQIATMLTLSVGVEVAAARYAGDGTAALRIVPEFGRLLSGAIGALSGGLVMFAAPLVTLWSGRPELVDVGVLVWLLAPAILVVPALPLAAILSYVNQPGPAAASGVLQLGMGLAAAVILSLPFGLYGIAAGLALGEAIALGAVMPMLARRKIGLKEGGLKDGGYLVYLSMCVMAFGTAAAWSAAAAWGALWLIAPATMPGLLGAGIIWAAIGLLPALYASSSAGYRSIMRKWLSSP